MRLITPSQAPRITELLRAATAQATTFRVRPAPMPTPHTTHHPKPSTCHCAACLRIAATE